MKHEVLVGARSVMLAAGFLACAAAHAGSLYFNVHFTLDSATRTYCDAGGCVHTAEDYALPLASFVLESSDLAVDGAVDLRGRLRLDLQFADLPLPRFTVASSSDLGEPGSYARASISGGVPTDFDARILLLEWLDSSSTNTWQAADGRWSYTGRSGVINDGLDSWFQIWFDRRGGFTISAVPEPAAALTMGLGCALLAAARPRRRTLQA